MVKKYSSDPVTNKNFLNKTEKNKYKNKKQTKKSLFIYDSEVNTLKLTAQLPHSFILEKTLLSCILIHCGESFQTLEIIMEHLPIDAFYFKNHQRLYYIH